MPTWNEVFSKLSVRRRYEVWFLRMELADGSGAWWFRYLLMNPGRGGCSGPSPALPVQVWATWFPAGAAPRNFIQGFSLSELEISARERSPFRFCVGENRIEEDWCRGSLKVDGYEISWNLRYRSTFRVTLSDKGWIGFSRTPHSDAVFSGDISLDGRMQQGDPLGFGVQGHNCGYRHRNFWTWTHAYFDRPGLRASTLEALVYEMPFGIRFRKAILWHAGKKHIFRNLQEASADREGMQWNFHCSTREGLRLQVAIDGRGRSLHHLPYVKTDCSGTFEVANNSLASASIIIEKAGEPVERLDTRTGAVLELVG